MMPKRHYMRNCVHGDVTLELCLIMESGGGGWDMVVYSCVWSSAITIKVNVSLSSITCQIFGRQYVLSFD